MVAIDVPTLVVLALAIITAIFWWVFYFYGGLYDADHEKMANIAFALVFGIEGVYLMVRFVKFVWYL